MFPYPPDQGKTHHADCYLQRGHHNCAVARVQELRIECFVLEALHALKCIEARRAGRPADGDGDLALV